MRKQKNVPLVTEQVDFEHVLICYDVEDADGETMTVSVKVLANNKQSFDVPVTELEEAIDEGITSGVGGISVLFEIDSPPMVKVSWDEALDYAE